MLVIDWTPVAQLVDDGLEVLLHDHWREVSIDHEEVPLDPDWSRIFALERSGHYRAVGVYHRTGGLIGYASYIVGTGLNFRSTLYATNDVIYVAPAHRGFAGGKLLLRAENLLADIGVRKIVYEAPVSSGKKLDAPLARLGYKPTEIFFCKMVEQGDGRRAGRTPGVHAS